MSNLIILLQKLIQTLIAPRQTAQEICAHQWSANVRISTLIALSCLVTLLYSVDIQPASPLAPIFQNPMIFAVLYGLMVLGVSLATLASAMVFRAPRQELDIIIQVWLWLLMVEFLVELFTLTALMIFPAEAVLWVVMFFLPYRIFVHAVFIAAALEFESAWMGFATLLVASISIGFIILFLLSALNIIPISEMPR